MPINYNKEKGAWEAQELNEDEKESLTNIAIDVIIDALGEQLAHRLMQVAGARMTLEDTPVEEMFTS